MNPQASPNIASPPKLAHVIPEMVTPRIQKLPNVHSNIPKGISQHLPPADMPPIAPRLHTKDDPK